MIRMRNEGIIAPHIGDLLIVEMRIKIDEKLVDERISIGEIDGRDKK